MEEECLKDPNAVQFVRCLKCDKVIKCSRHDTTQLIEHIKRDHPEVTVVESSAANGGGGNLAGGGVGCCGGGDNKKKGAKKVDGRRSKTNNINFDDKYNNDNNNNNNNSNNMERTPSQKGHLFRTSIEHWRPANGTIYCPFCCCKKQPLVKIRNERLSGTSCGANCMLACWPLCFLPFLLPGTNKEYLYCANCKCFLGLYDKRSNCIRPNKQFSERLRKGCADAKNRGSF